MHANIKRVLVVAATTVTLASAGSAAEAHTATEAIQAGCGSGHSVVSDGKRALTTSAGAVWGYVYLTYNSATGYNCVVTVKTAYHGTPSKTLARLAVQGRTGYYQDWGQYSHFAAVKAYGKGHCVAYWGDISNPTGTDHVGGGRWIFGNCG